MTLTAEGSSSMRSASTMVGGRRFASWARTEEVTEEETTRAKEADWSGFRDDFIKWLCVNLADSGNRAARVNPKPIKSLGGKNHRQGAGFAGLGRVGITGFSDVSSNPGEESVDGCRFGRFGMVEDFEREWDFDQVGCRKGKVG